MKVLKWILIVFVALAALVLIVPAFLPAETTFTAETDIAVAPEEICHFVGLFTNRDKWDPWLEIDPEAKVKINPVEGYIGSTYTWEGDKIGSGMMRVEKVVFGKVIQSSIWFGETSDSSVVEWRFKKTDAGSHVTWSFTSENKYPIGRLMMMLMSGGMTSSFESGLANMKEIIEADPPKLYKTGEIAVDVFSAINALVIPASGTMEEIGGQFERAFTALYTYAGTNSIEIAGPPFAYYYDYDEATGIANAEIGVQLAKPGRSSGEMVAKTYKEAKAITTVHSGKYEYMRDSYAALSQYAVENDLELTGGAFEIYQKTMMESPNPFDWKTMIAYPIK